MNQVDTVQYDTGEGPCLEASERHDIIRADDLTRERRWPRFTEAIVAETPVRAMFSVRLLLDTDRGALNFYSESVNAFTDSDIGHGIILASVSSAALLAEARQGEIDNLETALRTNRDIGTAIGILMGTRLLTRDQAFEQLRQASQQLNRKLRDIAADVIDTGTVPER